MKIHGLVSGFRGLVAITVRTRFLKWRLGGQD
jgi:hypothetical protein